MRSAALIAAAAAVVLLGAPTPAAAARALYDVSYLWHGDRARVRAYRQRVAVQLGPEVGARLRIVHGAKSFGLIYLRRGDAEGAAAVARAHTRLLKAARLEPAVPIRSRGWTFLGDDDSESAPARAEARAEERERRVEAAELDALIEEHIKELRRSGALAADERTAWSVFDFTTGEKLVSINEDMKLQAASLVKPFFALAFFHQVEHGSLSYGPQSRRRMEQMIQNSDNAATNWILRRAGGPARVQRLLRGRYGGIFSDTEIVEYIPPGGRTYRNKASVHDYSRFLFALWDESIPYAREIKRLMGLPNRDRISTGAKGVPAGTRVYHKTGSTSYVCGDMGILVVKGADGRRYPYTIIGVIEKGRRARDYLSWIRRRGDIIRGVSSLVHDVMSGRHELASGGAPGQSGSLAE
jgi:beta-lactamase class A